jgi:hypothetical protein
MSRQPIRVRPPADDDLQAMTEEELRKKAQGAAGTKKESPAVPQAGRTMRLEAMPQTAAPEAATRSTYFMGRYAAGDPAHGRMEPEMHVDRWLMEFHLPNSMRHCILELVHILYEDGLGAALAALHHDPALDRRFESQVRQLLAAIDMEDRRARS